MAHLILITGTIDDARDPGFKLQEDLLVKHIYPELSDDPFYVYEKVEQFPIYFFGDRRTFEIGQGTGSGKTLLAVHKLAEIHYFGGTTYANLGLVWRPENEGKPKKDWVASINSLEDLESINNCTVLIDDPAKTMPAWNSDPAKVISLIASEHRKLHKDIIITAQREKMIPPAIRDLATEWIVPIVTIREHTKESLDFEEGTPLELRALHFNGVKILKYLSSPIVNLRKLFDCYETLEISKMLGHEDGARPNQPGYPLEVKAFEYLKERVPGMVWQHLNGKHVFDIISDTHAIDVVGTDPDNSLILEHKDLTKHIRTAKNKGQSPYLMFDYKKEWRLVPITHNLNDLVEGKRIIAAKLVYRTRTLEKAML